MYNQSQDPSQPRSTDSWIEVSSQQSPSQLSQRSQRAQQQLARLRGRAPEQSLRNNIDLRLRQPSVGGSSQEEYEESESESDRIMTSSNEGLHSSMSESESRYERDERTDQQGDYGDGDGTQTTRGVFESEQQACFTPQPNAFSHPPSSSSASRNRGTVPGSYFPPSRHQSSTARPSFSTQSRRSSHSPFNSMNPSHIPDHEAALRASLNTLLSCAAAARSLPKNSEAVAEAPSSSSASRNTAATRIPAAPSTRHESSTLRIVPESVALGLDRPSLQTRRISSTPSSSNCAPSPAVEPQSQPPGDRQKRKAARSSSKERQRLAKKPKHVPSDEGISPTLLTWVVSASVLVIVSALSFSAGYKVGQETARFDAGLGGSADGRNCAKEVGRSGLGLRRLRWGAAASAVTA